jgi:hypothetical protein
MIFGNYRRRMARVSQEGSAVADIFFVSYASSDRDWAFRIGHELIALGHTPHIHECEILLCT